MARIEVVAISQAQGDASVGIAVAIAALPLLTAVQLLGLSGRQAAVVLLREAGRAPAGAITDWCVVAVLVAVVMALAVSVPGLRQCGSGNGKGRGPCKGDDRSHGQKSC